MCVHSLFLGVFLISHVFIELLKQLKLRYLGVGVDILQNLIIFSKESVSLDSKIFLTEKNN